MKTNETLGGFSAVFDAMGANESTMIKGVEIVGDEEGSSTQFTNPFDLVDEDDEDEDLTPETDDETDLDEEPEKPEPKTRTRTPKVVEEIEDETEPTEEEGAEQVTAFFDAIAESVGWTGIEEEDKPKTVESLVEYMKNSIEESAKPAYANDDIAALDEYVRNGGNINDYFSEVSNIDYDNLDLEDVDTQRGVIREFLLDKGFSETQIRKKLDKYEDADLLEDEATDAIEFLKESKETKRKELLENQKMESERAREEQQKYYKSVVTEIETLNDVRGVKIPKADKAALMEYIFKVEPDGRTRYQKDYSKSTKNLIESAYFTMKGDVLIDSARRTGETSAVDKLKKSLSSNKISGGSKQTINNGSATPLWSMASSQLLRRPQ